MEITLSAVLRECWVLSSNKRLSATQPNWTEEPTIHTIVVESVKVEEASRRQGHFRRFIDALLADRRFEMVIVEGVGNPILADALRRWGWDCDSGVMDFSKQVGSH